ncbi:MAG: hypothetical protein ACK4SR_00910 [Thiobacillus sp.]
MDTSAQLARTPKGHEEIFNQGHTVRPKCRQILFAIGDGITLDALRDKLPNLELDTLLGDLQRGGYIEIRGEAPASSPAPAAAPAAPPPAAAAPRAAGEESGLARARTHVLDTLSALAGTKSPAYRKMSEVVDAEGFMEALAMCRKVVAAVASPHQAADMEAQALAHLDG